MCYINPISQLGGIQMSSNDKSKEPISPHEHENREAERLAKELESPSGAQNLGDEAYKTAKEDLAKGGKKP